MSSRAPLTIAAAQPPTVAHDVAANARSHAAAIREARARLVVFPELSLTGYELDTPAIGADDARLGPIAEACAATDAVALCGAPVRDGTDRPFIAMLAIARSAAPVVVYRKMWLSDDEAARFASGPFPAVFAVDGWRLGLAICKDTGEPRHAAATAALGIDAYVAGVLEHAEDASVPDERARRIARDHGVWVAVASFAGSTGGGYDRAAGGSGIWARTGAAVSRAGSEAGAIARATLS